MDDAATARRDADYRRGTVLGLTVAEVFILLLFLLLLALLVLVRDWEVERERQEVERRQMIDRLTVLQDYQDTWQGVTQEFQTPAEIVTLRQRQESAERRANVLQTALAEQDLATQGALAQVKARREAERALAAAQQSLAQTQHQLSVLRTKGENPPCWYQTVPADEDGKPTREKPLYALNVAVYDSHMTVHRPAPPPGGAQDDGGGSYAEEAARLPLEAIPYGTPLTDAEVVRHLSPLSAAGEAREVRTYACVFWLRVWDKTSPDAKERWKQAHDGILEGMFGAYTVRDDAWPGA